MPYVIHVPPSSTIEVGTPVNRDIRNVPLLLTQIEKVSGDSPYRNNKHIFTTIAGGTFITFDNK